MSGVWVLGGRGIAVLMCLFGFGFCIASCCGRRSTAMFLLAVSKPRGLFSVPPPYLHVVPCHAVLCCAVLWQHRGRCCCWWL